ncbi:aminopeptidase C [Neoactinobaculum massilliense]|uniref:aminopeptidase C n=1 Tax=Neoactinobaculum massilliense TaxID=2364794 RepID=UPI000F537F68|nr:C1 family peptidase [Neoactinobaculum massilliense]
MDVTQELVDGFARNFAGDPTARVAQNALTQVRVSQVAEDRTVINQINPVTSIRLDKWDVTDQQKSGRCWMFSSYNTRRADVMKSLGLEQFEFSQAYTQFWDLLEKANYFLTSMVELADRPLDDRLVTELLKEPISDGGYWFMFAGLIKKYGAVPKYAMPETYSSANTVGMDRVVSELLRRAAFSIREAAARDTDMGSEAQVTPAARGTNTDLAARAGHEAAKVGTVTGGNAVDDHRGEVEAVQREALAQVYRVLAMHLGTPPTDFVWQYRDKDGKFHRDGHMTPQEFAARYLGDLDQYGYVVIDPRHAELTHLTIDHAGNMPGNEYSAVVVSPQVVRAAAIATLKDGEPVWMDCDVSSQFDRDRGIWDAHLFNYEGLYGVDLAMTRTQRMDSHQISPTHAMAFTGVDLSGSGAPLRWRVENSWGEKHGEKGFFTMNDSWLDEYLFGVVVRKDLLPANVQAAFDAPATVLPRWDTLC